MNFPVKQVTHFSVSFSFDGTVKHGLMPGSQNKIVLMPMNKASEEHRISLMLFHSVTGNPVNS